MLRRTRHLWRSEWACHTCDARITVEVPVGAFAAPWGETCPNGCERPGFRRITEDKHVVVTLPDAASGA